MTKTFIRAAFASALLATAASPALAQDSEPLTVLAQVTTNCHLSTSEVNFGNVDVTIGEASGAGQVDVVCTVDTPWTLSAGPGNGTGATNLVRKMQSLGGDFLNYALYSDAGHTTVWGNGVSGQVREDIGTGTNQVVAVYGRVLGGQEALPAGTYYDSVSFTVTY